MTAPNQLTAEQIDQYAIDGQIPNDWTGKPAELFRKQLCTLAKANLIWLGTVNVPYEPTPAMKDAVENYFKKWQRILRTKDADEVQARCWEVLQCWHEMLAAHCVESVANAARKQLTHPAPPAEDAPDGEWLCGAWGESDLPMARICATRAEVEQFFIDEWMGDKDCDELPEAMQRFDEFDWNDGPDLHWEFEIGGVSVKRICESRACLAQKGRV